MDIRGIVFDKDGTLFGFNAMWAEWCDRVLAELSDGDAALRTRLAVAVGYDMERRHFVADSIIVKAAANEVNQAWSVHLPDMSIEQIDTVGKRQLHAMPTAVPVTDLEVLCQRLQSSDIKLGVATNDFEATARAQLDQVGATRLFDFICGFDTGFGAKPQPGMILGFCEATGLSPEQVAMVGDSCHDLDAGRVAGAGLLVGVLTGPATRADLTDSADVVLDDIASLPEYLGVG